MINSPQNLQTFTEENFWCYTLMLLRTIYGGGPYFVEVEYLVNLITCWSLEIFTGLEIKKILRSPFGDQLEKYSRQMQIFIRRFL